MAESNGSNKGLGKPEQMSTETRLLIAFLLMGAIMFLTPYFFKPQPASNAKKTTGAPPTAENAVPPPPAPAPEVVASPSAAAPATQAQAEPPFTIDTDLFIVTFSNQGGNVHSWKLKKYLAEGKPLELVNTATTVESKYPFSIYISDKKDLANQLNNAVFQKTVDPDGLGVAFDYSDGRSVVHKSFKFLKNSYLVEVTSELTSGGQPVNHMLQWRGGFGDLTLATAAAKQQALYYDLTANKLFEKSVGDAKSGPLPASGNFSFAGLADGYFAAVFLPEGNGSMQQITFSDTTVTPLIKDKPVPFTGTAVGMGAVNKFEVFVGPKDLDLLKKVNPKLEQVVNFGWLSILAKPLFLVVNWFNDNLVHNFGWAIVVVTIVINFVLFPLKLSNMKSMRKMQALKPQIEEINSKYKSIKMTDPRKADQNQEVMDLYKKHGVNPMGGCVPMMLQIPFFFAFYKVFTVSVEMRGASWLWIHDLSIPETYAIKVLPIVMIASQFLMQKMTPQANVDPNQQKMMQFMPLVFGFMFYNFPSGLVLYYLTSNLVGMGQQWFFNHTESAQEAARSVEPIKKKLGRK